MVRRRRSGPVARRVLWMGVRDIAEFLQQGFCLIDSACRNFDIQSEKAVGDI